MAMKRIGIIVPGILGSILWYKDVKPHNVIWSDNIYTSYKNLISNPSLLKWTGKKADASLLKSVSFTGLPVLNTFKAVDIWGNLLKFLSGLPEFGKDDSLLEFAYDWRQSISESAQDLKNTIEKKYLVDLSSQPKAKDNERFVFFSHSMGGLVIRLLITQGFINAEWIDRIIHIGSPLVGSQSAFRSVIEIRNLPGLNIIAKFFRRKNSDQFYKVLMNSMRSFPSVFELMPNRSIKYLKYPGPIHKNPLDENCFPKSCVVNAIKTHSLLSKSNSIISKNKIKVYTIYTESHTKEKTDEVYEVLPIQYIQSYKITNVTTSILGDGTVLAYSAKGDPKYCKSLAVLNVDHSALCNDKKVVKLVQTIL